MSRYITNMPMPSAPLVDPASGVVSEVWWRWLLSMFARTGSGQGVDIAAVSASVAALLANRAAPAVAVTLLPSPFAYTAPAHGMILVAGDGMINLEIQVNGGGAFYTTGSFYGAFPLEAASQAVLTYIGNPTLTFIPT